MKKFFRYLMYPSYYQKLILSHLLVLFLAVMIMAGFNYVMSRDVQSRRMLDLVGYSGQQTAESIESRFSQMENVSEMVRYTLQQAIGESSKLSPKPQADAAAMSMIRTLRDSFHFCDISAWMPASFFSSGEGITFFDITTPGGRPQKTDVLSAPYNKLSWMFTKDYAYPFMRFSSYNRYNLLSCFNRVSTLSTPGAFCFFIDINEREIAGLLSQNSGSTPIVQYIVDPDGRIISHPDATLLGMYLDEGLRKLVFAVNMEVPVSYKDSEYLRYPLGSTDWSLIVSLPKAYLFSLSFTSANGILLAICIASAVSVLVSILISRQLMRKLMNMSSVIRSIEPNFKLSSESFEAIDVRMPVPAAGTPLDVLDELAIVFNTLLERLNHTMQNALTSSLTHEKLRYQLLRAKINPHFLYNILDSIKICNTLGRSEDANRMLSKLASFYRLILRKNDLDIITIGEELEIVDLYLNMEAISHEHTFSYAIECDTDIELFSIPRFVLQPLVENCVTHGLPGDEKHMDIAISLHYKDEAILITIEDNGLGMSEDQMSRLMQVIRGEGIPKENGVSNAFYGLNNVSARLRPYVLHPEEPIHYESAPRKGTRVTMELKQILPDDSGFERERRI